VADDMARAGLRHLGSATLLDNHEELLMSPPTSDAITRLETERLRTLARDLALNRGFRRDLYVRANAAPIANRDVAVKDLVVGSASDANLIPEAIVVPRGRIRFRPEFIASLRETLHEGYARSIGALAAELGGAELETIRNLLWLTAAGALLPGTGSGNENRRTRTC
jgi:hypothetical protein